MSDATRRRAGGARGVAGEARSNRESAADPRLPLGDEVAARTLSETEARVTPPRLGDEVLRLGVWDDDGRRALLGLELELLGDSDADTAELKELVELDLVVEIGTCR